MADIAMSAIGRKRTCPLSSGMSAFGGKADISLAVQRSAYDPKRTLRKDLLSAERQKKKVNAKAELPPRLTAPIDPFRSQDGDHQLRAVTGNACRPASYSLGTNWGLTCPLREIFE